MLPLKYALSFMIMLNDNGVNIKLNDLTLYSFNFILIHGKKMPIEKSKQLVNNVCSFLVHIC